ncbi:glycogen synthase GlgA [Aneurinibacillus tyrosinisolvens]|uniref:glycogen synthase GlgA n=1 Tax=Aneurinibacillus tyrosinisolvens TaxID=1443435 RepID=UPI00063F5CFC|nr:glycogen synthase GlgA [Aneurinibacillus tyrosinisolvens]
MKILFAASEAVPFVKTGGLADVIGSLPKELKNDGLDVRVILPKYEDIPAEYQSRMRKTKEFIVPLGWRRQYCGIEEMQHNGIHYYFVDNEYYFKRNGIYGFYDEAERFAYFSRAILEALPALSFQPDIIHCHDWHSALVPLFLQAEYRTLPFYEQMRTVLTIHNLKYQGIFPPVVLGDILGLGEEYFTQDKVEFYGGVNFMKGGLVYADFLTTVSPTYAKEIQQPHYGEGLDGVLCKRRDHLHGTVNGIDYEEYNPETDPHVFFKGPVCEAYKQKNKAILQEQAGLPVKERTPLIALVSRLVEQKGIDLIACVLEEMLGMDVQFIILGTGEPVYERLFKEAMRRHPEKLAAQTTFSEGLARKIYAGADIFLMPSKFEPCGIGQLISMRYGTIPVVRETGGLYDTVEPYNEETGEGTGFTFVNYNAHEMLEAVGRAVHTYRCSPSWQKMIDNAGKLDSSWRQSAKQYSALYECLLTP